MYVLLQFPWLTLVRKLAIDRFKIIDAIHKDDCDVIANVNTLSADQNFSKLVHVVEVTLALYKTDKLY